MRTPKIFFNIQRCRLITGVLLALLLLQGVESATEDVAVPAIMERAMEDFQAGRYAEAESLFKYALVLQEKVLGLDHPDVATTLNNLAELYKATGRFAEAEALYQRALTIMEKPLGPEHPDVARRREIQRHLESEKAVAQARAWELKQQAALQQLQYKERTLIQARAETEADRQREEVAQAQARREKEKEETTKQFLAKTEAKTEADRQREEVAQAQAQAQARREKEMHEIEITKRFKAKTEAKTEADRQRKEVAQAQARREKEKEETSVTRYPTVEAQGTVTVGQAFSVQVALTEDQITPEVQIQQGAATTDGQLDLSLPANQSTWNIEVVLSAQGFTFRNNKDTATITLPRSGDSTPALFHLTPKPIDTPTEKRRLFVSFWTQGQYLAKVVRNIQVIQQQDENPVSKGTPASVRAEPVSQPNRQPPSSFPALVISKRTAPVDLTVFLADGQLILHSPHLSGVTTGTLLPPEKTSPWLTTQFAQLSRAGRGLVIDGNKPVSAQSTKAVNLALAQGFGRKLYQDLAPPEFKRLFWRLKDQLGPAFESMQIYTDNPDLPWELMRPVRSDGSDEQDFLGMTFRIGRWHVSNNAMLFERPPQVFELQGQRVIAPHYTGARALPSAATEVAMLERLRFRRIEARFEALQALFTTDDLRGAIVHFAGHGQVTTPVEGRVAEHILQMNDDQDLNILMWRALTAHQPPGVYPLVFFNACDIGQAQRVANFVEGWAPTVLESGAIGYIGGLWSLNDAGAAAFATDFYTSMARRIHEGPVLIATLLQQTRQLFYKTGDPTFLAYVYYGDPNLILTIKASRISLPKMVFGTF